MKNFHHFLLESMSEDIHVEKVNDEDIDKILDLKYDYFKSNYGSREEHHSYAKKFFDKNVSLKLMKGDEIIGGYIIYKTTINEEFDGWINLDEFYYNLTELLDQQGLVGFSLFVDKKYRGIGLGKLLIDYSRKMPYSFIMGYAFKTLGNVNDWMKRRYLLLDKETFYITIDTKGKVLKMTENGTKYKRNHPELLWK